MANIHEYVNEEEALYNQLRTSLDKFAALIGEPHILNEVRGVKTGYWLVKGGIMVIEAAPNGRWLPSKAQFHSLIIIGMFEQVLESGSSPVDLEFTNVNAKSEN
jgi:hypothetical protein